MMTIKQVFALAIKLGIENDPRGKEGVEKYLWRIKREYNNLGPEEKKHFDTIKLTNPYLDCGILFAEKEDAPVKRVLVGIDIDSPEIILASQLNERGKKIDLVIGHHPTGKNLAYLEDAMQLQIDVHHSYGVPIHMAEKILEERKQEISRGVHPLNHYQSADIAKLLNVNFMNVHTASDNMVDKYMHNFLKKTAPDTVGDLMEAFKQIPEYQEAAKLGVGPKIFVGNPKNRIGRYLFEMTGGTNPSNKVYEYYSQAGISTVIGMHVREQSMETIKNHHLNVIIGGHMSSDSLGMNLFLDELEKKGVEIIPCGGLIRVSRVKKAKKQ